MAMTKKDILNNVKMFQYEDRNIRADYQSAV